MMKWRALEPFSFSRRDVVVWVTTDSRGAVAGDEAELETEEGEAARRRATAGVLRSEPEGFSVSAGLRREDGCRRESTVAAAWCAAASVVASAEDDTASGAGNSPRANWDRLVWSPAAWLMDAYAASAVRARSAALGEAFPEEEEEDAQRSMLWRRRLPDARGSLSWQSIRESNQTDFSITEDIQLYNFTW